MTATVNFAPDVEAFLAKTMAERHEPLDQVLNAPYDMGLPSVDFGHKVLAFAAELEDQELMARMALLRRREGIALQDPRVTR